MQARCKWWPPGLLMLHACHEVRPSVFRRASAWVLCLDEWGPGVVAASVRLGPDRYGHARSVVLPTGWLNVNDLNSLVVFPKHDPPDRP